MLIMGQINILWFAQEKKKNTQDCCGGVGEFPMTISIPIVPFLIPPTLSK